jgi:hypothetical protein
MAEEKKVTLDNFLEYFAEVRAKMEVDEKFRKEIVVGKPDGNPIALGPRVLAPEDWSKKQVEAAKAGATRWIEGFRHPSRNPVDAAIAADAKRKDKLAKAEAEGKWLKKMKKVNVDEMISIAEKVGSSGFTVGITAREEKIKRVVGELQPEVAALATAIDKMPDATDADREARMLAARRGMIAIGKKRAGT